MGSSPPQQTIGPVANGYGGEPRSNRHFTVTWDGTQNIRWQVDFGPGLSSPWPTDLSDVLDGLRCQQRGRRFGSSQDNLQHHLLCVDRATGNTIWSRTVARHCPRTNLGNVRGKRLRVAFAPSRMVNGSTFFLARPATGIRHRKTPTVAHAPRARNRIREAGARPPPAQSSTAICLMVARRPKAKHSWRDQTNDR